MHSFNNAPVSTRLLHRAIRLALLPAALYGFSAVSAVAALPAGSTLVFTDGAYGNCTNNPTCNGPNASYFTMQVNPTTLIYTGVLQGTDGAIKIGVAQTTGTYNTSTGVCSPAGAACSHGNVPYDDATSPYFGMGYTTDHGPIDTGWGFFGNTGLHFTTTAPTVLVDSGTTMTLDFTGWHVTWNAIPSINMGGRMQTVTSKAGTSTYNNGTGIATLTCSPACANEGSSFTLDYSAVVPQGDPSNFGGVPYALHLTGVIAYPTNRLPTAAGISITAQEDTLTNWTPSANDPDTYQTLTCSIVTGPLHGTAAVAVSNSCTSPGTYTPNTGYTGPDSFTYKANDGKADSNTATVSVTVSATPPPNANNDILPTATGVTPVSMDVTTNDTKGTYNIVPASVAIASQPAHGLAAANGDGTVTYTADSGFSGSDSFTYNVSDDATPTPQVSNDATVNVTVQADLPSSSTGTFAPGTLAVSKGSTTGGGLTTTDVGVDSELDQQCVGGCFDFDISGLAGADATVVLPLSASIPDGAVYRKLIGGTWVDFDTTSGTLASAAALSTGPTVCPEPSSASYQNGLTAGDDCIRMTIVNGGANDADGADDDTVLDPGGVGVKTPTGGPGGDTRTSGSSGCSIADSTVNPLERSDWWVLAGFMVWLGALVRTKHRS